MSDESFEALRNDLQLSKKFGPGKPDLRFYPNGYSGQKKIDQSVSLKLDPDDSTFETVLEDIHENFRDNVEHVDAEHFHDAMVINASNLKKHVIYYLYTGDKAQVSLAFKRLSMHRLFKGKALAYFAAVRDPPTDMFENVRKF